jgi:hypothetical protein
VTPGSQAWAPDFDASERAAVSRVARRPPFLLMVHPERWELDAGRLRPVLGRLKLVPGVSNVEVSDAGRTRIGKAQLHYTERGWIILPVDALPPAQEHRGSYLCRPPGRPDVTLVYWEQTFAGSEVLRCDEGLRDEFFTWLVDSGRIPEAPLYVLERLRDQAREEAARCADRAMTLPSYRPRAERAQQDVDALEALYAARLSKLSPVPTEPAPDLDEESSGGSETPPAPVTKRARSRKRADSQSEAGA